MARKRAKKQDPADATKIVRQDRNAAPSYIIPNLILTAGLGYGGYLANGVFQENGFSVPSDGGEWAELVLPYVVRKKETKKGGKK